MLLSELLQQRSLGLIVRACPEALKRPIRWVHTTELREPAGYLSGGELILTTGLWRRRPGDSETFVTSLVAAQACGLVYGLPRPHASMPPDLVEACRRHGLPLLEAAHELPFISISETVVGQFGREREATLHRALRRNERLVEALASGHGAEGILKVVAHEGLAAWLLAAGGRVLARAGRHAATLDAAPAWRSIASAETFPADLQLPGAVPASAFALGALGGRGAYLVVDRRIDELTAEGRAAVDQGLAFLALELARLRAEHAAERRLARELLDLLASGETRALDTAARLRAIGIDPEAPLAVLVAIPLAGAAEELADAIEPFAAAHQPAVVAVAAGEVGAVVQLGAGEDPRELARALAAQAQVTAAVGAGSAASSPAGWRRSLIEARELARFLAGRGRPGVAGTRDLGSHELLLALLDDDVCAAYRESVLAAILEHDRRRGSELLHTLETFFATGGHWKETAARLNLHVNTLRHRLERIEELTGRDLGSTTDRVDLFLALQTHE